jgi:hypothetical protein
MIDFQPGQDFLVAVSRRYQQDEIIEAHGLKGRIVEAISHQDYIEVWAFRGFPSEGVSAMRPKFYYRCVKLSGIGGASVPDSKTEVRGDQESGDQESA